MFNSRHQLVQYQLLWYQDHQNERMHYNNFYQLKKIGEINFLNFNLYPTSSTRGLLASLHKQEN